MKKEWKGLSLEVLNINMTMASTVYGPYTDEAYVPGQYADKNDPTTWNRFTS